MLRRLGRTRIVLTTLALIAGALVGVSLLNLLPEAPKQGKLAVAQLSARTEVVALGASHIYTAVDPRLISRPWVNLSAGLMNYVFIDAVFAAHADKLTNLRAVVLDLDPLPGFTDTYTVSDGDYRHLLDLAPSLSALDESWTHKLSLARDRLEMYQLPFRRAFMREKVDFDTLHELERRKPDWVNVVAGHEGLQGTHAGGAARAQAHFKLTYTPDFIPRNVAAFKRIIARAKQLGVPVILARFPVRADYNDGSPPEFEQVYQALLQAAAEASPQEPLPMLDYTREPAFADDEFFDGDHLNQRGAVRLTPRLAADVNALLGAGHNLAAHH